MRHEFSRHGFTKHCITLGSALAIGLAAVSASSQAQQPDAEPKQKALIAFKMDFLSRFKKAEPAGEVQPVEAKPAEVKPAVVTASAIEPLPSGTARTHAVQATNTAPARPLPPTSLPATSLTPTAQMAGHNSAPPALAQPLPAAHAQFPSVLPPSVPSVQLTSGQIPLPAGQLPFSTTQSPVVIMMPAGWQPDGSYTFAPRTVMSPEVPAEHWPTSQRNPLGDDSHKGLFDWPQIAKKITNSTIGEPEIRPQPAPAPAQTNSRALFAVGAPAAPQATPAQQPQAAPAVVQEVQTAAPAPQPSTQVEAARPASKALFAPQPKPSEPQSNADVATTGTQPTSKALFAPQPKQAEPKPEEPKSRALLALLSKPMNKTQAAPSASASKALFALGPKKTEPAVAPAPAVVPQYVSETPLPPNQSMQTMVPATATDSTDPDVQPPAPPSVSNPRPAKYETVKSDDPKMKWRAKGAPSQVVKTVAVTNDAAPEQRPEMVTVQANDAVDVPNEQQVTSEELVESPAEPLAQPAMEPMQFGGQRQPAVEVATAEPVSRERSLLGKHFPAMSSQTPRNANDSRSPWRRQAERDAAVAAEKKSEQPMANSKAILPNVAAMFPAVEKPNRQAPSHHQAEVTPVAATEDTTVRSHSVRRAHETSAESTDSYYAAPWENEVEAELEALERRQVGGVSNRRAAIVRQTMLSSDESLEQQPRVPFEVDELEQEKAAIRRSAKAPRAMVAERPKQTSPAGSPSNGARMAEQRSPKSYRQLTGEAVKRGLARPLAIFNDMTKLPTPLKKAADNLEHQQKKPVRESADRDEIEQNESSDEQAEELAATKRPAAKRQPVHELRQTTTIAASVSELEDRELAGDKRKQPTRLGQRGGRRQVETTVRTSRDREELEQDEEEPSGTVTIEAVTMEAVTIEDAAPDELDDTQAVRPAVHIRNKHGNQVKIYSGDAN